MYNFKHTNRESITLLDDLVADDRNSIVFRRRRFTASVVHCQLPCSGRTTCVWIHMYWILNVLLTSWVSCLFIVCRMRMNYLIACFHFRTKNTISFGNFTCKFSLACISDVCKSFQMSNTIICYFRLFSFGIRSTR